MLVTVAGADGAGKSTVTPLVAERLRARGHDIDRLDRWDIVDNPAYPAARFMRPDVPDARICVAEMPGVPRFLFLMWSMSMALIGKQRAPGEDPVLLLDGYWMKHAASEIVYGLDHDWVSGVVAGLPRSDAVVYLRVEPDATWERKRGGDVMPYECGMDPACREQSYLRHQGRIQALLDAWAERDGWTVVDGQAPLPAVVDRMTDELSTAMGAASAPVGGE